MIRIFPALWLLSSIVLFAGCMSTNTHKIRYHATVGLKGATLDRVKKHLPVRIKTRIQETDELIEVIIHRDDKRGR